MIVVWGMHSCPETPRDVHKNLGILLLSNLTLALVQESRDSPTIQPTLTLLCPSIPIPTSIRDGGQSRDSPRTHPTLTLLCLNIPRVPGTVDNPGIVLEPSQHLHVHSSVRASRVYQVHRIVLGSISFIS